MLHFGDNHGPTHVNAFGSGAGGANNHNHNNSNAHVTQHNAHLTSTLSHLSLQQMDSHSTGEASPMNSNTIHPTAFYGGDGGGVSTTSAAAAGTAHTPVQHNSRVSHTSASHGWGGDGDQLGVHGGEPHSPLSFTGFGPSTADVAGVSFYASAAPTVGSEDGGPPDAKAQLLQSLHIHTPTSPSPYEMPNNDFTVQNTTAAATTATTQQHQQQQQQQPHQHPQPYLTPSYTAPSAVITESSSSETQGIKMRHYALAQQHAFYPPDGAFLAAVPAVEESYLAAVPPPPPPPARPMSSHAANGGAASAAEKSPKPGHSNSGSGDGSGSGSGNPLSNEEGDHVRVKGVKARRARGTSADPSSTSPSSSVNSVLSVPYSTAETQCHDTTEAHGSSPPSQLPLPATIDPLLTASTSVSSFTVSSASATASPYPTSRRGTTRVGPDPSTRGSKLSQRSKMTPVQRRSGDGAAANTTTTTTAAAAAASERSDANVSDSADSPLISLEHSKAWPSASSSSGPRSTNPSASGHPRYPSHAESEHPFSAHPHSQQQQQPTQVHSERGMPIPRAPQVAAGSGSGKTASSLSKATPVSTSGSGATYATSSAATTNTQSSYYSTVTLDSGMVRPRGSHLVGMRMPSPDSHLFHVDAPRPARSTVSRREGLVASPLSSTPTPLTSFTRPSASASNGFACSSSFGLPAFMSASSASLVAFPRLDAPLRAAMAAAAAVGAGPPASSSAASRSPHADRESRVDVAGAVLSVPEVRPPLPPPLSTSARAAAPLHADHGGASSSGVTTNDDGRDSHCQLSSDGRTVDNSSFHSPSLPQQSSRGFTVTSTSFAFDNSPWGPSAAAAAAGQSPRTHARRQSSMHNSAASLYQSSSMLSDNVLQTLAHGMALGGASAVPWRSVMAEASSPTSARYGYPTTTATTTTPATTDSEMSLFGNRSNNNAYVRLPFSATSTSSPPHPHHPNQNRSHRQYSPRRRASLPMPTSYSTSVTSPVTAAAPALPPPLQESSLTGASSYLYGSSMMGLADPHSSSGLPPFLTSMRGQSMLRSCRASPAPEASAVDHFCPPPTPPSLDLVPPQNFVAAAADGGRSGGHGASRHTTPSSMPRAFPFMPPVSSTTTTRAASPTRPVHADGVTFHVPSSTSPHQQRLQPQTRTRQPTSSGSFFAAADEVLPGPNKFNCSRTGDIPLLHGTASLMTAQNGWRPTIAPPTVVVPGTVSAAPNLSRRATVTTTTTASSAAPDSPLHPHSPLRLRSSASPSASPMSGRSSENSILVLYGAKSTDDSASMLERASELRRGSAGGASVSASSGTANAPPRPPRDGVRRASDAGKAANSAVARRRLPSNGFSAGDSHVQPPLPHDVQATFLQSVHAATVNAVAAPVGCGSALRHLFTGNAPPTPPCMTASIPLFSFSFAGSTGGRGVYGGDAVSTDPSEATAPSQNASAAAAPPSRSAHSSRRSVDVPAGLPEVQVETPAAAETSRLPKQSVDATRTDVSASSTCSLVSSAPRGPQLPKPLLETPAPNSPCFTAYGSPGLLSNGPHTPGGNGFGGALSHLLPLVEREHASMSTSSRLPTLRSLGSSNIYTCRVERASEQVARSRQSVVQRSQWAARDKHADLHPRRDSTLHTSSSSSSSSAAVAEDSDPLSLHRSKPFASTYDGSDAPYPNDDDDDGGTAEGAVELMAAHRATTGSRRVNPLSTTATTTADTTSSFSKNPQSGYNGSQPYSTIANRGLLSAELTQRSSMRSDAAEAQREHKEQQQQQQQRTSGITPVKVEKTSRRHARPGSLNGVVQVRPVTQAADTTRETQPQHAATAVTPAAAIAAPEAVPARDGESRADDIAQLSIPSFHRHRDVESMLDDAETRLRRAPVCIIPVLNSRWTRALNPNLSSTMYGQSLGSMRTSVLSLRTPAQTASGSDFDARRVSASITSAEKTQRSQALPEMSITISSVPFGMQDSH